MPNKEKKAFVVPHPPREENKVIEHFEAKTHDGEVVHKATTEKETAEGAIKKGYEVHIPKDREVHKGAPKPEHFKKFVAEEHAVEVKEGKRPHKPATIMIRSITDKRVSF